MHPEIDNPEYSPDPELYYKPEICTIGFDLWQVKSGTIFDNVLITDDIATAKKYAEDIWKPAFVSFGFFICPLKSQSPFNEYNKID